IHTLPPWPFLELIESCFLECGTMQYCTGHTHRLRLRILRWNWPTHHSKMAETGSWGMMMLPCAPRSWPTRIPHQRWPMDSRIHWRCPGRRCTMLTQEDWPTRIPWWPFPPRWCCAPRPTSSAQAFPWSPLVHGRRLAGTFASDRRNRVRFRYVPRADHL
ncbi:hypothetical protein C8J57DRAFT_1319145, partial [Mycena rebaudengoi]